MTHLVGEPYAPGPTAAEAELLRLAGDWFHQAGPGSCPPEVLALLREYVNGRVTEAVEAERARRR